MRMRISRTTGKTTESSPHRQGFTLVEILVALAIIAILSAFAFPVYRNYIDKAKVTLAISTLETVRKIMEGYHIDHGTYPVTIDFATGKDDQGSSVLEPSLLGEVKRNIYSVESYSTTAASYILNARAQDTPHTVLVLTPEQVVIQVP
jgi:prepilin-type N-terminal cleavage/methylation domain-containing protein